MSIEILEFNNEVSVVARKNIHSSFHVSEDIKNVKFETSAPHECFADINGMMEVFTSSCNFPTGILPPGVLAVTDTHIVFERQPEYKTVFVIPKLLDNISDPESERVYTYQLPIPWQLYIIQYGNTLDENGNTILYPANVRLHFMKSNLTHADQELYMAPLTNFYANGTLCRPMFSSMEEFERYPNTIAGVIESAYDWVWNSGSNLDLTICPLAMYTQFSHSNYYTVDASNTIWKNYLSIIQQRSANYTQYYCGFDEIDLLYRTWEKYSLAEVSSFDWPSNYITTAWYSDAKIHEDLYFQEYLKTASTNVRYEMHWDEEEDQEYQCEYEDDVPLEDQCYCLHPIYDVDKMRFYVDTNLLPIKPRTYRSTFQTFIKETIPPTIDYVDPKKFHDLNVLKILHSV